MIHNRDAISDLLGALIALCFAVVVIIAAINFVPTNDCPRGSVTASGIAWCR